jgi:hypothetical protein
MNTHNRCGAHSKRTGQPCRNRPMLGQRRCRMHGASEGSARAKGRRVHLKAVAADTAAELDVEDPGEDPVGALLLLAGEAIAWKNALRGHVENLTSLRYEAGSEQVRGEVLLFERGLDRCANVLGKIARLDLDERLVQASEAEAGRIVAALGGALEHLGFDERTVRRGQAHLARRLRPVPVGGKDDTA